MTMINPTPEETPTITSETISDEIQAKVTYLEDRATKMETMVYEHRNKVRKLYNELNEIIYSDGLDESDEISFGDLSLILQGIFNEELEFVQEYTVTVRYVVDATFTVKAKCEEDAREIGENIEIDSDPSFDFDSDSTDVEDTVIDTQQVYVERKVI